MLSEVKRVKNGIFQIDFHCLLYDVEYLFYYSKNRQVINRQ